VYERFAVTFFVVADGRLHFPQYAEAGAGCPALHSAARTATCRWWSRRTRPPVGVTVEQRTLSTGGGAQNHAPSSTGWWCARPGRRLAPGSSAWRSCRSNRAASSATASPARACRRRSCRSCGTAGGAAAGDEHRSGPVFLTAPESFGLYGNRTGSTTRTTTCGRPVRRPRRRAAAQRERADPRSVVSDCAAPRFLWPFDVSGGGEFTLISGCRWTTSAAPGDFADLTAQPADAFEAANADFWRRKLDHRRDAGDVAAGGPAPVAASTGRAGPTCSSSPTTGRSIPGPDDLRLVLDPRFQRRSHRLQPSPAYGRPGRCPAGPGHHLDVFQTGHRL
jgi:hypothetical protein